MFCDSGFIEFKTIRYFDSYQIFFLLWHILFLFPVRSWRANTKNNISFTSILNYPKKQTMEKGRIFTADINSYRRANYMILQGVHRVPI